MLIVHSEMVGKQLAQLVMAAGQVVTKAFTNAVRQEIRMSQEAAKARYSGQQNSAQAAETAKMGMTVEEAMMILNVEKMDAEAIEKNYEHLFKVNEKKTGGSFYLQSKVLYSVTKPCVWVPFKPFSTGCKSERAA